MALRNAFYYSYFQELVDAEVVSDALHDIVWDKRTEYPDVLNAIRRFNIYQEGLLDASEMCIPRRIYCGMDFV